jgi:hypothetical protein
VTARNFGLKQSTRQRFKKIIKTAKSFMPKQLLILSESEDSVSTE